MNSIHISFLVVFIAVGVLVIGISWVERRLEGVRVKAQAERDRQAREARLAQMTKNQRRKAMKGMKQWGPGYQPGRAEHPPRPPHIPQPRPETRGIKVNPPPAYEKPPAPPAPPAPRCAAPMCMTGGRCRAPCDKVQPPQGWTR